MFNNLIESRPKKERTTGGIIFSVVFHTLEIGAAVYGTLEAKEQLKNQQAETLECVKMEKKNEPPPPKEEPKPPPPRQEVVHVPPPPHRFQVLVAPVKIPDVLPDIDLSKKVTSEADFTGKG